MRLSPNPLARPRLLPATILALSALLVCKSVILVRAAAGEAVAKAQAADAPSPAPQPASPQPAALQPAAASPPAASAAAKPASPAVATASSGAAAPLGDAEQGLLLDLRRRHDALEARARELDERAAVLDAANRRLADRVQQLTALQTRLEGLEAARQLHSSENWSGLVKIYEAMKPRDAATIFDALDMQVLLQVLDRMQERRAAPVLAAMQPDRARLATQLLAELRNRASAAPAPAARQPDPKG